MNEICLYGTVGGGWWDEDFFTPNMVRDQLAEMEGPLTVRINSGGGIAADGQTIYTMLRDYAGNVSVVVDGIAASAASLIAMAGDTITMRLGAVMMIHDPAAPWVEGRGTEQDHLEAAKGLSVTSGAYAAVYAKRAGITPAAARDIMRAETYYDGDMAVAAGFATATDDDTQADEVARFDYRVYAHAPDKLINAGGEFATRISKTAVMAHLAGTRPPQSPKGKTMAPRNTRMDDQRDEMEDAPEDEDDTTTMVDDDPDGDDQTDAPEGVDDVDGEDDDEAAPVATAALAVQIMDLCTASGRPDGEARDYIAQSLNLSQVVAQITAKRSKETPVNQTRNGAPRTRIMRDDRTTRRTGMTSAIAAQIMGTAPAAGPARDFMDMSLVEMAASCIDHRGPMRNAGQKAGVFMAASHATSDFPGIFENAMNKVLLERYQLAEPTFKRVSRKRNFSDFRAHPMVRAGDFPTLKPVNETGEIKYGTFGESRETAVLAPYAIALRISRQMMINDELGAIDELLSDYGQSVADFEEKTFYAFALNASLSTGLLFRSANNNLAGAGTAITVDAVSAGRAAIRKQKGIDGAALNLTPSIILVGPDQETAAEQLIAAVQPQEAGKVNPFSGKLEAVVTAQITDNRWHLLASADRPGGACFVHGYLEGAEAPRVRTEEAFGTQGMAMSLEHDFGLGAVDYRGAYKNPGQA